MDWQQHLFQPVMCYIYQLGYFTSIYELACPLLQSEAVCLVSQVQKNTKLGTLVVRRCC